MVSTTCALIVIPHTQVISHGVLLPLIVLSLIFSLSVLSHSMVSYYHQLTHTLSLMFSLSDLTTSSHQLISLTLSLMISFSPTHLTYQCYPCMSSLTSGHSLPWCPTSPTDHELPEHSLTPTHLTTDHSHSPIVIPALLVLTKSLLSHTMSTHSHQLTIVSHTSVIPACPHSPLVTHSHGVVPPTDHVIPHHSLTPSVLSHSSHPRYVIPEHSSHIPVLSLHVLTHLSSLTLSHRYPSSLTHTISSHSPLTDFPDFPHSPTHRSSSLITTHHHLLSSKRFHTRPQHHTTPQLHSKPSQFLSPKPQTHPSYP